MSYKVNVKTTYRTGIVITLDLDYKHILAHLNELRDNRLTSWINQDASEDYFNDLTKSQFIIKKIKFSPFSGDLESVELLEE